MKNQINTFFLFVFITIVSSCNKDSVFPEDILDGNYFKYSDSIYKIEDCIFEYSETDFAIDFFSNRLINYDLKDRLEFALKNDKSFNGNNIFSLTPRYLDIRLDSIVEGEYNLNKMLDKYKTYIFIGFGCRVNYDFSYYSNSDFFYYENSTRDVATSGKLIIENANNEKIITIYGEFENGESFNLKYKGKVTKVQFQNYVY